MKQFKNKKIIIVVDWLTSRGGAENVLFDFLETFPEAEIFTPVADFSLFPEISRKKIHTSFLQKLPSFLRKKHQFLIPFLPFATKLFNTKKFDILISSSSSGFSKCVKKSNSKQIHICYCHSPVRYLYHACDEYIKNYPLPFFFSSI